MCIFLAPAAAAGGAAAGSAAASAATTAAITAAITTAVSVAATAATTIMQQSAAAKQNEALSKAATKSANNKAQQEQTALIQKQIASQQEEMNSSIDAAKARATARTAAGEAGVSGLSVDALINDYTATESRYRDSLKQNMEWETQQFKNRVEGHNIDAQNMYTTNKMNAPSYLGAALRIGGQLVGGAMDYNTQISQINAGIN
jgi:hypothetical protein